MVTMDTLTTEKRQAVLDVGRKYGARSIRVFGSVARGENPESSDVDFLVEFDKGRTPTSSGSVWSSVNCLERRSMWLLPETCVTLGAASWRRPDLFDFVRSARLFTSYPGLTATKFWSAEI